MKSMHAIPGEPILDKYGRDMSRGFNFLPSPEDDVKFLSGIITEGEGKLSTLVENVEKSKSYEALHRARLQKLQDKETMLSEQGLTRTDRPMILIREKISVEENSIFFSTLQNDLNAVTNQQNYLTKCKQQLKRAEYFVAHPSGELDDGDEE